MSKVHGSGDNVDNAAGGKKSGRLRKFYRLFSCVGTGSEAASSFDQADAPTTPRIGHSTDTDRQLTDDDRGNFPASAVDAGNSAADWRLEIPGPDAAGRVNNPGATPRKIATGDDNDAQKFPAFSWPPDPDEPPPFNAGNFVELEIPPDADGEGEGSMRKNLTASSDSIDLYVADYVARCRRSIKRPDESFADVFSRVPGCRPKMLFASHAEHLRNLAPWVELSYEVEDTGAVPGPPAVAGYDAGEFGNVDVVCFGISAFFVVGDC